MTHELLTRASASAGAIGARSLVRPNRILPEPGLSTDNAAMIAAAFSKLARGEFASLDVSAQANLRLAS